MSGYNDDQPTPPPSTGSALSNLWQRAKKGLASIPDWLRFASGGTVPNTDFPGVFRPGGAYTGTGGTVGGGLNPLAGWANAQAYYDYTSMPGHGRYNGTYGGGAPVGAVPPGGIFGRPVARPGTRPQPAIGRPGGGAVSGIRDMGLPAEQAGFGAPQGADAGTGEGAVSGPSGGDFGAGFSGGGGTQAPFYLPPDAGTSTGGGGFDPAGFQGGSGGGFPEGPPDQPPDSGFSGTGGNFGAGGGPTGAGGGQGGAGGSGGTGGGSQGGGFSPLTGQSNQGGYTGQYAGTTTQQSQGGGASRGESATQSASQLLGTQQQAGGRLASVVGARPWYDEQAARQGAGYAGLQGQEMDLANTFGQSALLNLNKQYAQLGAQADQDLINRGLSNTTVRSAIQSGLGQRKAEDTGIYLPESVAQLKTGILQQTGLPGLQSQQALGQQLGGMLPRQDQYTGQTTTAQQQAAQQQGATANQFSNFNNAVGTQQGNQSGSYWGTGTGGGFEPPFVNPPQASPGNVSNTYNQLYGGAQALGAGLGAGGAVASGLGGLVGGPLGAIGGSAFMSHGGTVPGYAPGKDTVPALLSPGEAVLTPEAARRLGHDRIRQMNAASGRKEGPTNGGYQGGTGAVWNTGRLGGGQYGPEMWSFGPNPNVSSPLNPKYHGGLPQVEGQGYNGPLAGGGDLPSNIQYSPGGGGLPGGQSYSPQWFNPSQPGSGFQPRNMSPNGAFLQGATGQMINAQPNAGQLWNELGQDASQWQGQQSPGYQAWAGGQPAQPAPTSPGGSMPGAQPMGAYSGQYGGQYGGGMSLPRAGGGQPMGGGFSLPRAGMPEQPAGGGFSLPRAGPQPMQPMYGGQYGGGTALQRFAGGGVAKHWIQGAINPAHKGYCTPMAKATCTPRRKALAKRFKSGDLS